MAKRRSSIRLLESEEDTPPRISSAKIDPIDFASDSFSSEGDDLEKFNERVKLV